MAQILADCTLNLSDLTDVAAARVNLGGSATGIAVFTGSLAAAQTALGISSYGATLIDDVDAAAARTTLDVYQRNVYAAGGLISAPKRWVGTGTTDGSGQISVNISSAGFAAVTAVQMCCLRNNTSPVEVCSASALTVSNTTVTGIAVRGTNLLALGNTARTAPAGVTIYVTVEGT